MKYILTINGVSNNILTTNLENYLLYEMKISCKHYVSCNTKNLLRNVNVKIVPIGDNLSVVLRL